LVFALLVPENAFAQGAIVPAAGEAWYKVAAGIIAIPAAMLGLLVSWNMMKKTRMETRKLELEITEKQKAILTGASPAEKLEILAAPLGHSRLALLIVVRFVLLDLTLRLWAFVPAVFSAITALITGAIYGVIWLVQPEELTGNTSFVVVLAMLPAGLRSIFSLVTWAILIGFGWPLFKDTCAFLNIPIKGLFDLPVLWRRRRTPADV